MRTTPLHNHLARWRDDSGRKSLFHVCARRSQTGNAEENCATCLLVDAITVECYR